MSSRFVGGGKDKEGVDLICRRTGRQRDCFGKCLLFASSSRNLEEGKEATNPILDTDRG